MMPSPETSIRKNTEISTGTSAETSTRTSAETNSGSILLDREHKARDSKPKLKFAIPVKARVIGNYGETYVQNVGCAILMGFSNVFLGAFVMGVIIYSIHSSSNYHAALLASAYHFFVAEAILCLSYINGWSTPMRWKHRRLTHMILQVCGIICATAGTLIIFRRRELSGTVHSISGITTLALTVLTSLVGIYAIDSRNKVVIHVAFGLLCFSTSSVCAITGLLQPEFEQWTGNTVLIILIVLVVLYSTFIVIATCMKYIRKVIS